MKNVLAVLAGLVFTIAVSLGLDQVMTRTGVFTDVISSMTTGDWLTALSYRLVAAIGGGWITARLAQSRPVFLAVVLGAIGTLVGLAGFAAAYIKRPELGPLWYPFLLVITAIPCTWLGARGKLAAGATCQTSGYAPRTLATTFHVTPGSLTIVAP